MSLFFKLFSKTCEYAIKATIYIANNSKNGNHITLKEIAGASASPEAFTAKILQTLVHNQIIDSSKGRGGGFYIDPQKAQSIKLKHIVVAIDGEQLFTGCLLGLDECNELKPCPIHYKFVPIKENMNSMLEETSLVDLVESFDHGTTFLKR